MQQFTFDWIYKKLPCFPVRDICVCIILELHHKKSCFDIDCETDGTKKRHIDNLPSFPSAVFTMPFGVSLWWEVSKYYFVMHEGFGWTYYEFNVIITVTNNFFSF